MTTAQDIEKSVPPSPDPETSGASTPATTTPPALPPPPEGGREAWLTVFGGFCAAFVQFGLGKPTLLLQSLTRPPPANAFGVFQGYYETHQLSTYSPSTISWIGAVQQFLLFFGVSLGGDKADD